MSVVEYETDGRVATITLNRPEARNALNAELLAALVESLERAALDPAIGAIVLTGAGGVFCAGADLKEAAASADADFWVGYSRSSQSTHLHQLLPRLGKPVIAAVDGAAVAGGCGVAMSCDLVVAGEGARFGYPEVGQGLVAAMVMVSLTRVVGRRQAMDLLLTGRFLPAREALELGMINKVVPDDQVLAEARSYAAQLASKPAVALRMTKELLRQVQELDYDRALEYARDVNQMLRQISPSDRRPPAAVPATRSTAEAS